MAKTRTETDSLGEMKIPIEAFYGVQSVRASENFPISGTRISSEIVIAYAKLKKSAAKVNAELGKLDSDIEQDIVDACDGIIAGKYEKEFIVDIFQAGAGTSTNMNINEVICNIILKKRREKKGSYDIISPNDHINMSQSTNDTYPTAMRIALVSSSVLFIEKLEAMKIGFIKLSREHKTTITSARTHLQDAVPITWGQEFGAYGRTLEGLLESYKKSVSELKILGIGGSAAGTGINTHPEYHKKMIHMLSKDIGTQFFSASNLVESMQSQRQIAEYMNTLGIIAIELSRICNDFRLLSSGPHTGIGEIILPAVQPGSSIMPGKINPSILESVNMVCFHVIGKRTSIEQCLLGGQLNLNVFMPLMSHETLESTKLLTNAFEIMQNSCIDGMKVNIKKCEQYVHESNGIFTALNPILGYSQVDKLIQEKEKTGKNIRELLQGNPKIDNNDIEEILDPLILSNI